MEEAGYNITNKEFKQISKWAKIVFLTVQIHCPEKIHLCIVALKKEPFRLFKIWRT